MDLTSDATSELQVLGHECDSLRVECAKVAVLKEACEEALARLLKCKQAVGGESNLLIDSSGDVSDQSLEG